MTAVFAVLFAAAFVLLVFGLPYLFGILLILLVLYVIVALIINLL